MRILAIDTSTESCSAALWQNGMITMQREIAASRRHGQLLLEQITHVLSEADTSPGELDFIAVSRGPGGFTGVRMGIGVAQGLAFSLNKPVIPVSTLAVLAQQGFDQGADEVLALLDARMHEVYWAFFRRFEQEHFFAISEERITLPTDVAVEWTQEKRLALGPGLQVDREAVSRLGLKEGELQFEALPSAAAVAKLASRAALTGSGKAPEHAQPVYLRNKVAEPRHLVGSSLK